MAGTSCVRCGTPRGVLSLNYSSRRFPGINPEVDYLCLDCDTALGQGALLEPVELRQRKGIVLQQAKIDRIKNLAVTNANRVISITLASGAHYEVSHVMLYHGATVKHAQNLQAEARKNLGGISTGLGFWGSPGWVLGGALALGLLESAASGIAADKGLQQLQEFRGIGAGD